MFNTRKSKIDNETHSESNCETCLAKETPEHYLLHCSKYEKGGAI